MDGIKTTGQSASSGSAGAPSSPGSNDQTLSSAPVMVDLLHPNEDVAVPDQAMTAPVVLPKPQVAAPVVAKPVIAPITPPLHAPLEPTFEMVTTVSDAAEKLPATPLNTASATASSPSSPGSTGQVLSDVVAPAPKLETPPAFSMPPEDAPVAGAGLVAQPSQGRGKMVLIIVIVLLILAGLGVGAYVLFFKDKATTSEVVTPKIAITAGTPSKLSQEGSNDSIAAGATTGTAPSFQMTIATNATTGTITPEVEIQPVGTAFTGTATVTGAAVSATGKDLVLSVTASQLADGSYHWQARSTVGDVSSAWVSYAAVDAQTPDFILNSAVTAAPSAAPTISAVTGGTISGTTISVTQSTPTITGKADAGSTVTVSISPDAISLTPTVGSDGTWSVAPSQAIANGDHSVIVAATNAAGAKSQTSYTLKVAQVASTTTPTTTTPALTTPVTPVTPTTTPVTTTPDTTSPVTTNSTAADTTLAATGDATGLISLIGLVLILIAGSGLVWLRRLRLQ